MAEYFKKLRTQLGIFGSQKGAITLEYVMIIVVIGFLMVGVELLFLNMSIQIITRIETIVLSLPNI